MKIGDKVRVKTENLKTRYMNGGCMESMLGGTFMIIGLAQDKEDEKWVKISEPNDFGFWWREEDLEAVENE